MVDLDWRCNINELRLNEQMRNAVLQAGPIRPQSAESSPSLLRSHSAPTRPRPRPKNPAFGVSAVRPIHYSMGTRKSIKAAFSKGIKGSSQPLPATTQKLVERLVFDHGSVFAGWQVLDPDARGFLGREQLRRSLAEKGFRGHFAGFWMAMDSHGHGVITLTELDSQVARAIVELKDLMGDSSLRQALVHKGFQGEVGQQDLVAFFTFAGCGNPLLLAKEFLPHGGISLSAVNWFDKWNTASVPSAPEMSEFLQETEGFTFGDELVAARPRIGHGLHVPAMTARAHQHETERFRQRQEIEMRTALHRSQDVGPVTMDVLMQQLTRRHGNLVRAWRREVDPKVTHIGWRLYVSTLRRFNFHGSLSEALQEMSAEDTGVVELANFATEEYVTLVDFRRWMDDHFSSASEAFDALDVRKVRRLPRATFCAQVKLMGYHGKSNRVFDYLVLDVFSGTTGQGDYNSLQKTDFLWIENIKAKSKREGARKTHIPQATDPEEDDSEDDGAQGRKSIYRRADGISLGNGLKIPAPTTRAAEFEAIGKAIRAETVRRQEEERRRNVMATTLESFKQNLIKRHGNLVRAWRHMFDVSGKGTMGKMNFVRAMKEMQYGGDVAEAWKELNKNGSDIITLSEFAPSEAARLAEFRRCLIKRFGDAESAFQSLDVQNATRLPKDIFIHEVKNQIDYRGDADLIFDYIETNSSKSAAITVDEFVWLDQWQSRADLAVGQTVTPSGTPGRPSTPKKSHRSNQDPETDLRQTLIDELILRAGTLGRAWRKFLDPRGLGSLTWFDFVNGMKQLHCSMNLPAVWLEIVPRGHMSMTLRHLDMELQDTLLRLHGALSDPELPTAFWMFQGHSSDQQEVTIGYEEFQKVLAVLGLESDAKIAFEALRHNQNQTIEQGAFRYLHVWGSSCIANGHGVSGLVMSHRLERQESIGSDLGSALSTAQMDGLLRRQLGLVGQGQGGLTKSSSAPSLGIRSPASSRGRRASHERAHRLSARFERELRLQ